MKTFLIFYDLRKEENSEGYKKLIDLIKSNSYWAKPCESAWFICSEETVGTIRTSLQEAIDANDKLVVIEVTGCNWSSYDLPTDVTDWMKSHIKSY